MATNCSRLILVTLLLTLCGQVEARDRVQYRTTSAHNQITVEESGPHRLLRFNGSMETRMWIKNPLWGHFEYTEYFHMPLLWNPKPKRVLMLGLGGEASSGLISIITQISTWTQLSWIQLSQKWRSGFFM